MSMLLIIVASALLIAGLVAVVLLATMPKRDDRG